MKNCNKENLYLTVITCPKCNANCSVALDLNRDDNKLSCQGCGTVTEINLK